MDNQLYYLCLAVSLGFLVYFIYLFTLDRQLRELKRRLDAREQNPPRNFYERIS